MIARLIKRLGLSVVKLVAPAFFSRQYLRGPWFDDARIGWVWALRGIWQQRILGFNREVPWPMVPGAKVSDPANFLFHIDDIDNFQSHGCYFQNFAATIEIGQGTKIAPNVGIITANHELDDPLVQAPGYPVKVGRNCWIGMNAVILPGVTLGDHTVVGAGAVVTKSFPDGHCVIGGNPARVIKQIDSRKPKTG